MKMVKIQYTGKWQPSEIKDVSEKEAQVLINSTDWKFLDKIPLVVKQKPIKIDNNQDIWALNKAEQVAKLMELGLTEDEIEKLKYERHRVEKIIELSKNE